jgi:helicase
MTPSSPQTTILQSGLLNSGFNAVLQMPTGSGKTWLAEQAIASTLSSGSRALYLTPLRAQAAELTAVWQERFTAFKVGVFTGDFGSTKKPYPVSFNEAQLLVMTPERLDACTRAWRSHWNWIPEVDLLIVDELHLLGELNRGARLEGAISRMRRMNPFARIIGLSATLGNPSELADWLDGVAYRSSWRPVPLTWRFVHFRNASEKPQLLIQEVGRNALAGGHSLVFVQSRRRAEELSCFLQSQGLRARHHHAGLSHDARRTVENEFRRHKQDVLVATATLEMGVNLPVRQVVLYDVQKFDGENFGPLSTNSVWQRVGRAGRRGLDEEGEAVLIMPAWERDADKYTRGAFEPIRSALSSPRTLAEQVVTEVASGLSRTAPQLVAAFNQSLAAHQSILPDIRLVLREMHTAGMIVTAQDEDVEKKAILRATRLGRIATRHLLTPATVLLLKRATHQCPQLTFVDLLAITASSADCEPILPVDFEELDTLAASLSEESSFLLQRSRRQIVEILEVDGKRLLAALKMALVMRAWTRTANADVVASQHGCYPFEVERLRESMSRLLIAFFSIFEKPEDELELQLASEPDAPPALRERVQALSAMIAGGLDEFAVTLTLVPGIGPKLAKRLQTAGIAEIDELAAAESTHLAAVQGISKKRAINWIAEAKSIASARTAFIFRETAPLIQSISQDWVSEVDPYRLRRALDLKVAGSDGNQLLVTGGLEPHIVENRDGKVVCDCSDFLRNSKARQCKHVLAVRLFRAEAPITTLARRLCGKRKDSKLDVFDLWFDGSSHGTFATRRRSQ